MKQFDRTYSVGIVGIGARTPVGLTARSSAAAVRAGITRIGNHPYFIDKAGQPMAVAMDSTLPVDLNRLERFYALAIPAIEEALAPLQMVKPDSLSMPFFLGLPEPRPGLSNGFDQTLAQRFRSLEKSPARFTDVFTFPRGHAAGLLSMAAGWQRINEGQVDLCLSGGVDTYLEAETLEWLDEEGQLKSAENLSGFPPGEGAAFCLLASATAIARLKLKALAWLVAVAVTKEENRIKTDTICIGNGLSEALSSVTRMLNLPHEKVNFMICDLNGEPYRSEEFTYAVLRTQLAFVDFTNFQTPADCCGDLGAASGPLFTSLAVASSLRGVDQGPRVLIWNSSEDGDRAAALLYLGRSTLKKRT